MHPLIRAVSLLPVLALAACATNQAAFTASTLMDAPAAPAIATAPAATTASAAAQTDLAAYVDPTALALLSGKSRSEAASAQFNALQFGRVGAPRNWIGDGGASGQVTVGPYLRVNLVDCRDFTHSVTVKGVSYSRKGTACREVDGSWTVSTASAG
jgi:surface antigen